MESSRLSPRSARSAVSTRAEPRVPATVYGLVPGIALFVLVGFFWHITREDYFECTFAFVRTSRIWVNRDSATVILDRTRPIFVQRDGDLRAKTGHRFVDGIVHNFPYQMVQTGQSGRTDIHAWALTDRVETLQNLDVFGLV